MAGKRVAQVLLVCVTTLASVSPSLTATGHQHPCVGADGAALASCFGFNATDATDTLHSAFNSGAMHLTIDDVNGQNIYTLKDTIYAMYRTGTGTKFRWRPIENIQQYC